MQFYYLYATVIVLNPIVVQAARKRFTLEIQNISCPSFTNHLKHYDCAYQKVANGKYLINTKLMYDSNFGKDIDMHVRVRVTPWNGKTSFNFIDVRVNVCAITSQVFKNGFLQKLFNEALRSSNLPLDCSFKANVMYRMDNFSLTDEFIPVYAPFLNATFSLNFFKGNLPTGAWTLYVALIPI